MLGEQAMTKPVRKPRVVRAWMLFNNLNGKLTENMDATAGYVSMSRPKHLNEYEECTWVRCDIRPTKKRSGR